MQAESANSNIEGIRAIEHPRWSFSLFLLAAYLLTFHAWLEMPAHWVAFSGWMIPLVLLFSAADAWKKGCFVNRFDAFNHGVVILDLWIEGVFVRLHEGWSFYGCAIAFALVLGAYRAWILRGHPVERIVRPPS